LPGFEPFKALDDQTIIKEVVRKQLTKQLSTFFHLSPHHGTMPTCKIQILIFPSLATVTAPLAEETSMALEDLMGNSPGTYLGKKKKKTSRPSKRKTTNPIFI
jgi:hypothetical protein